MRSCSLAWHEWHFCVYARATCCVEKGPRICSLVHPRVAFIGGCRVKLSCTRTAALNAGDWAVKSLAQYYLLPPVWRGPQLNGRLHFACRIVPEHTHGTLGFDQCTPLTPTVGAFSLVSGGISIHSGWGLYSVEVPRGRGFLTELITPVWAESGKYGYGAVPVTWDCAFG